jgi:gluconate:H+ symporter, GntP family
MRVIEENGALGALASAIIRIFGKTPLLLTAVVTLFIMFPAMLTGITATSVLTTGALIAPPLVALGLPHDKAAATIAVASVMGMLAPPINLLAMLIGQGVDMPYIGLEKALLAITIPIALISSYTLAYPHLRKADSAAALTSISHSTPEKSGVMMLLPLVVVFVLMIVVRVLPQYIPDIGVPLIFMIGALLGLLGGRKVKLLRTSYRALLTALPVIGLLVGVGAFLQIMTLTGVRGLLVVTVLGMPTALKYLGLLISLPLFGGVSAFASAMVFGVPFLLSLLGSGSEIVICAAISILAGLGDVLPPSAINARFAAQVTGDVGYMKVVKQSLPFIGLTALAAIAMIYWAPQLKVLAP